MSIATALADGVRAEIQQRGGARVQAVGVRIGELSGVDAESLRFCWDVLLSGTDLDGVRLEIENRPWLQRCSRCGNSFPVENYNIECPACGSAETKPAGGSELELAWLELEGP